MRLTLRTLLAYLDDVLEPAEAKEIGKKVQESPVAKALVGRIREVMRRRRLGAADLEGPAAGIDPNLVAQYLDNTLPPEQVADIERVCLQSDQQLAEAAACHQILTLALAEPVEISPSSRERLYVLGPVDSGQKLQAGADGATRGNGAATLKTPVSVKTIPGSAGPSFEETLPEYLKTKTWSAKAISAVAVLILLAAWLGAIYSDPKLRQGLMGLGTAPSRPSPEASVPGPPDESSADVLIAATPRPPFVDPLADAPLDPPAIPEDPVAVSDVPADAALVLTRPVKPAKPAPPVEPVPAEPAPPPPSTVTMNYLSQEGILLRWNANDKNWYVVPKLSELKAGQIVACPEPFEAALEIDRGALQATLLGDSVLEIRPPSETAPFGLNLLRGRLILHSGPRGDQPRQLALQVGPRQGRLDFSDEETWCGVEFLPIEPVGFEQAVPVTAWTANLYAMSGGVGWSVENAALRFAEEGLALPLLSDEPPVNFGLLPEWLDPQRRKANSLLRRFARQYEKEFELNQPIDPAMRALIRAPRPQISELAVRCLVLTDSYPAVVQAMAQADHEDTRKAAMTGLKLWLGTSADNGPLLIEALQTHYERPEHLEALYRLLWGVSAEKAKTQQASLELVDWLRNDKIEIRELAFANLVRLTGRKLDYRPLGTTAQREPAIKRWYDLVIRDGALVKGE
jgi:hypothetical protein